MAQSNEKGLASDSQPVENLLELRGIEPLTPRLPVDLGVFYSSHDCYQLVVFLLFHRQEKVSVLCLIMPVYDCLLYNYLTVKN
jgi:hypothetical protein